jgi:hypothetical protein
MLLLLKNGHVWRCSVHIRDVWRESVHYFKNMNARSRFGKRRRLFTKHIFKRIAVILLDSSEGIPLLQFLIKKVSNAMNFCQITTLVASVLSRSYSWSSRYEFGTCSHRFTMAMLEIWTVLMTRFRVRWPSRDASGCNSVETPSKSRYRRNDLASIFKFWATDIAIQLSTEIEIDDFDSDLLLIDQTNTGRSLSRLPLCDRHSSDECVDSEDLPLNDNDEEEEPNQAPFGAIAHVCQVLIENSSSMGACIIQKNVLTWKHREFSQYYSNNVQEASRPLSQRAGQY